MTLTAEDLARKAAGIRLLLFDVDGVLTDGRILLHADGSESKAFSIRDGTGIVWAQRAGVAVGLLSARHSGATNAPPSSASGSSASRPLTSCRCTANSWRRKA
jgi:3-deoxy-D-manno-octulosonate 8-phosphate phosphatase (KDO 8-P phosphatase)